MRKKIPVIICGLVLMIFCFSVLKAGSHVIFSDEATPAPSAEPIFNISVSGGYTYASMAKVNSVLQNDQNAANGGILNTGSNAFYVALDINFPVFNGIKIGPRIEYINVFEGNYKDVNTTWGVNDWDDFGASMIPIYLGISYSYGFGDTPLSVAGGIYGGCGFANGYRNINVTLLNVNLASGDIPLYGSAFAGEILLSGDYNFSKNISLSLNFGYRLADVSQMQASNSVYISNKITINKGETLKVNLNSGDNISFDYSGVLAGLSLRFGF